MSNHVHRPKFKFSQLMSLREGFTCEHCEEPLRFNKTWHIVNRVWYYIFLGFLIYSVLSQKDPGSEAMIRNFIIIFAALIVYLIGAVLINRLASYEIDERVLEAKAAEESERLKTEQASQAADKENLSAEQEELRALYKHYEQMNSGSDAASIVSESVPSENVTVSAVKETDKPVQCVHEVVPSWRNYLAGTMEFDCAKCGERIGFSAQIRKSYNMILMVITLLMLVPMLMMEQVSFGVYIALTVTVLLLATIAQYLLVKKAPKELV